MSTEIHARLSKNRRGVLCGVVGKGGGDCGQVLGKRLKNGHYHDAWRPAVWLGPGWCTTDYGVWRLSHHAQQRRREGKAPAERRVPARVETYGAAPGGWIPANLPVKIECPKCGFVQLLDEGTLDVDACTIPPDKLPDAAHPGLPRALGR